MLIVKKGKCVICGKEFTYKAIGEKYVCSKVCYNVRKCFERHRVNGRELTEEEREQIIIDYNDMANLGYYNRTCPICDKHFKATNRSKKYCSTECSRKYCSNLEEEYRQYRAERDLYSSRGFYKNEDGLRVSKGFIVTQEKPTHYAWIFNNKTEVIHKLEDILISREEFIYYYANKIIVLLKETEEI